MTITEPTPTPTPWAPPTVPTYEPHERRLRFYHPTMQLDKDRDYEGHQEDSVYELPTEAKPANVVSSLGRDGRHRLVIDLDVPAHLEPSTTPGHSHLYIDVSMSWDRYEQILTALRNAGIIEPGYYLASLARMQTFVRLPGVQKPKGHKVNHTAFDFDARVGF